jgi:hypothetical protein
MLVPDRLTVKMTAKICEAASSALPVNSLERSLMIEWATEGRVTGQLPRR